MIHPTESTSFDMPSEGDPFADAVRRVISNQITLETRNAPYRVFTRDKDTIKTPSIPSDYQDAWLTRMDDRVGAMVGGMQKDIQRMMAARSRVQQVPGFRSGRLNPAGLHRLAAGDDRVFRRKFESKSDDTAVTLLMDNSGSMGGPKLELAMLAGYALSQTLERVRIAHECLGFTTRMKAMKSSDVERYIADARDSGIRYSRAQPIYMPIYKSFDERLSPQVRQRFAAACMQQTGLAHNIDGESLEYAAGRLLRRPEARKVIIVLSDGLPAASPGHNGELASHLHATVAAVTAAGIDLVGIGIMSDAVKTFYPRSFSLRDISALPAAVMGELRKILTL